MAEPISTSTSGFSTWCATRVGDRIDRDLPHYLEDALPRLSEAAIEDAAQPLEDLEEHRRNVENLQRTAAALEALASLYADYARAQLHRRATVAADTARAATGAERAVAAAHRAITAAEQEVSAADEEVVPAEWGEVAHQCRRGQTDRGRSHGGGWW